MANFIVVTALDPFKAELNPWTDKLGLHCYPIGLKTHFLKVWNRFLRIGKFSFCLFKHIWCFPNIGLVHPKPKLITRFGKTFPLGLLFQSMFENCYHCEFSLWSKVWYGVGFFVCYRLVIAVIEFSFICVTDDVLYIQYCNVCEDALLSWH